MSHKTLRFTTDFLALTAGSICAIGTNKFFSDELKLYPTLMGLSLLLAAAVGISHAISQSADVRKYFAVPIVVAVILQATCHVRLIVSGHWTLVWWQMLFCTGLVTIVCACWVVDRRRNSTTSHGLSITNRAARHMKRSQLSGHESLLPHRSLERPETQKRFLASHARSALGHRAGA
jgi:hypothetical protein